MKPVCTSEQRQAAHSGPLKPETFYNVLRNNYGVLNWLKLCHTG